MTGRRLLLPLTPFHYPMAYGIYRLGRRLSLPGLVVGSMFPDFEVPVMMLLFGDGLSNHLVLHSLLGAATIGTVFSLIITRWVYPSLISSLFSIEKGKVERNCELSSTLVFSVLLGNVSHVLLDLATHLDNPVLWPFVGATRSSFVAFLGLQNASLMIHVLMAVFFLLLVLYKRRALSIALFVG